MGFILPSLASWGVASNACHPSYPGGRSGLWNHDSFHTWKFLQKVCDVLQTVATDGSTAPFTLQVEDSYKDSALTHYVSICSDHSPSPNSPLSQCLKHRSLQQDPVLSGLCFEVKVMTVVSPFLSHFIFDLTRDEYGPDYAIIIKMKTTPLSGYLLCMSSCTNSVALW